MSCKEFDLDDLLAITAIPVADYSLGLKAWQLTPTVTNAELCASLVSTEEDNSYNHLENAIVIGLQPAVTSGKLIPIIRASGKAKDDEDDSVAGRKHSVDVSCEADDREGTVWNYLLTLERTPCHLLLSFRNGAQGFVAATEDTYTCEVSRDGAKTSVKFDIDNLMGIQLVTI